MARIIAVILIAFISVCAAFLCTACGGGNDSIDSTACAQFIGPVTADSPCASQHGQEGN